MFTRNLMLYSVGFIHNLKLYSVGFIHNLMLYSVGFTHNLMLYSVGFIHSVSSWFHPVLKWYSVDTKCGNENIKISSRDS